MQDGGDLASSIVVVATELPGSGALAKLARLVPYVASALVRGVA